MDSDGNIYMFENHPNPDKFVEEMNLVRIPSDELPTIANMDQKQKRNWYKTQKALEAA